MRVKVTTQNLTLTQRTYHQSSSRQQTGGRPKESVTTSSATLKERREGRMKDALALGGDEGRDKLR